MNRFDQDALFDRLAAAGRLDLGLMPPLAAAIAEFHAAAERRRDHGGNAGMAWVIEGNAAGFAEFGATCLDPAACFRSPTTPGPSSIAVARCSTVVVHAGFVRQCHGDLHLRNIVLLDGRPTLFDGVEFNDEIACTDVLYDLAFLLMDLWRRRLPRHANAVWNRYLAETGDLDGLPCCRCFSRAAPRSEPRRARPRRSFRTMRGAAASFRSWRETTSRWRRASSIRQRPASSRSAACPDRESRRWLSPLRRPWAPCLAPSCSEAMRSANDSAACRFSSASVRKDIRRRCLNASTRR